MSDNLAEEFRKAKIGVGDIVELANFTNGIDQAIGGSIGEEVPLMNGWLIQVTAIGETKVLGNTLTGHLLKEDETGYAYKFFKWIKGESSSERIFGGCKVFRKVGYKTMTGCSWIHPDLDNIYTRCQRKIV